MKRLPVLVASLSLLALTAAFIGLPRIDASLAAPDLPAHNTNETVPVFVKKGMDWLAVAQFDNGGWGAGLHARQDIHDPHAVQVDPATTAFAAMALLRSGSTLTEGPYRANVHRALTYLLDLVDDVPDEWANITNVTGTQPQAKLGQNIDVAMAAQLFTRVLPLTTHDAALRDRVANALEVCVTKLARTQDADGSWNSGGGWAGVLQSAMANNALELAEEVGVEVDDEALDRSRRYQQQNIDAASGAVRTEKAAGISLYTIASNQRATAKEAREAEEAVRQAASDGRLAAPTVSAASLRRLGYADEEAKKLADAYATNQAATAMLAEDDVLSGFGNNGGEEFLSYMMTSEALVVKGGAEWEAWYEKMHARLAKIQNPDGSWSGHHCITSPVFCTAAVILTMMADQGAV